MVSQKRELESYVDAHFGRLIQLTQDLVRIPSENRAPHGSELACQRYIFNALKSYGWDPQLYVPDEVPGIQDHPLFFGGRSYRDRPNIGARRNGRSKGRSKGRSLVLSGHVDTVPIGSLPWTRDPFGGEIEGDRLYGRGANDMKGGIATNLFVIQALHELGIRLEGDLVFESVVDEEWGGANGTLAGRLSGFNADAAVVSEPSALRICPAQRGARTVHLTFQAPNGGVLAGSAPGVIDQLRCFLNALPSFAEQRQARHRAYAHLEQAVPVSVTRIATAAWGTSEPGNNPSRCQLELFWQTMPGEALADIDRQFQEWIDTLFAQNPDLFRQRPDLTHPIRWLPGSAIADTEPIVTELRAAARSILPDYPATQGIEGPCDLFVFHAFGVPAALWGASGGNTHNPDEYVEIESLRQAAKVLLAFVCRWCGTTI